MNVRVRIAYPHVSVPWGLVNDRNVDDGAYRLHSVLLTVADWRTMASTVSQQDLADRLGVSVRAVQLRLRALEAAAWLASEYDRRAHTTTYTLLVPKEHAKESACAPRGAGEGSFARHAKESALRSSSTDVVSDVHPPPTAAGENAGQLVKFFVDAITDHLAGVKPIGLGVASVGARFRQALTAGDTPDLLRRVVKRWLATSPRNVSAEAFLAQFIRLRAECVTGRGDAASPAIDARRRQTPGSYLPRSA